MKIIVRGGTVEEPPANNYYDAVTQGGLDNTGSSSVTSAIGTAITAYKNGGYDGLYFPAGTYLLSTDLTVPDNTVFVGPAVDTAEQSIDGVGLAEDPTAHLSGRINFGNYNEFSDLLIGSHTNAKCGACVTDDTTHDVSFTRCQFRGGGGASAPATSINRKVVALSLLGSRSGRGYNFTFSDCRFEVNTGTTVGEDGFGIVTAGPHTDTSSMHDILFERCHFGIPNQNDATVGAHFHVEIWSENFVDPVTRIHNHTVGFSDINFEDCVFEASHGESIDYVGCELDGDSTTGICGPCHITGCIFKGNGVPSTTWYNDIVCECGMHDVTITGNTFYRGAGMSFSCSRSRLTTPLTFDSSHKFNNNHVYATDAYLNTGITHTSNEYVNVAGNNNEVKDNVIVSNVVNVPLVNDGGSSAVITGNDITCASGGWYAITLKSGADYCTVNYNTSHNASTAVIQDSSGGTHNTLTPNTKA